MHLVSSLTLALHLLTPVIVVSAAPPASGIDAFLTSAGVNPSTIPASVLAAGGLNLTCGILEIIRHQETVEAHDGAIYTTEREAHWSPTAWEYPTCIFTPNTTQDVIFAVNLLRLTGMQYAMRGGGHSPHAGWASIDNGVLISMSSFNTVTYDATSETVRLGMGNRWGDVYQALLPYNRIVVGGRIPPVGMALITGGGLSHLSNKHGFAADNVQNFEIVLANGELVNANATFNSDLWWALKGGSNNFGIVTHITTNAIPSSQVWGGIRVYNNSQLDVLMSAFAEYQEIGQLDTNSSLIADLATTNDTLAVTLVYFAPVERPAAFDPFYNIPAVEDTTQIYPNFLALIEGGLPQVVPRWSYGYTNLWLDNVTYVDILNICQEQGTKLAGVNGGTLVIIPQPISKTMVDASQNTGGNPLGLRSRAQLWMNLSFGWNLASDDETVFALIVDLIARIEAVTKARNLYDPYIFLNDAWKEQDVMRHYGDDNFAKLKSVSAKYDPQGTFQYQVPGGFKLI